MQRRRVRDRVAAGEWKVQIVHMEVHDVELIHALEQLLELQDVMRELIHALLIGSQRPAARRNELRRGHRIAARHERDVVTLPHEFLGEVRHDAFRTPITSGRYAFHERGDLSNPHTTSGPPWQLAMAPGRVDAGRMTAGDTEQVAVQDS
jgi:hypothetical protein